MNKDDLHIAKISALLNSAIKQKNSKDYQKALSLLQKCDPKPSLQQILEAQAEDKIKSEAKETAKNKTKNAREEEKQQAKDNFEDIDTSEMTLKEMEQELEKLRKQDPEIEENQEKTKEELEELEEKRIQEVIKRYEKTFGRIKDIGSRSGTGSVTGKSIVSSRPSKTSKISEFSTVSQREAFEKLKKLDEEEEKIRKEKEELLKFLELRSQGSKYSSRPVTVSSIMSANLDKNYEPAPVAKPKEKVIEKKEETHAPKLFNPKRDEVAELFKNLY